MVDKRCSISKSRASGREENRTDEAGLREHSCARKDQRVDESKTENTAG
jgi:hypothetical protein